MLQIKKSFQNKKVKFKKKNKNNNSTGEFGKEVGAVVENNVEHYPKTGSWKKEFPLVSDKCIACGTCVKFCPENTIRLKSVNGKKKAVVDMKFCKGCGVCAEVCPVKAIEMK